MHYTSEYVGMDELSNRNGAGQMEGIFISFMLQCTLALSHVSQDINGFVKQFRKLILSKVEWKARAEGTSASYLFL